MFTDLDRELFPDDCEVVEIPPHDLFVYKIFKNGSSTIAQIADMQGWRTVKNQNLDCLDRVDILIRPSMERYISGVESFCISMIKDNPHLNLDTVVWLAIKYNFLNRHYLTQFHWLLNLKRFISDKCQLRFHDWSLLEQITSHDDKPTRDVLDTRYRSHIEHAVQTQKKWFLLDDILTGLIGQTMTWSEILNVYQQHPSKPLDLIVALPLELINVLR